MARFFGEPPDPNILARVPCPVLLIYQHYFFLARSAKTMLEGFPTGV